ncbi:bifunctional folylpolyglutamate synthase/dihydrofolate synthase [Heyndrickxia sporothermodurans]|nr:bifunctional folylpolyglutamate synthase/dihydrofolate synthase [Heyndrickxia sporothermodurans]
MRKTQYHQALNFLSQFNSRSMNRKNGFHHQIMWDLLELFSINLDQFKFIQITGSCGKGSTAHLISSILTYHEYNHGLFTGPHLTRYEERFSCNGQLITNEEFASIVIEIEEKLKFYHLEHEVGHMHVMIVIALLFFQRKRVELVVFENGVGGKADPSNVIDPIIAVLTEITMDHAHLLGSTIEDIIIDKSCIIKHSTKYVICGMNNVQARNYLLKIEAHDESNYLFMNRDYVYLIKHSDESGSIFHFKGEHFRLEDQRITLIGNHQVQNASNALAVIDALMYLGYNFNIETIQFALKHVQIACRMEIVEKNGVKFLFDGAHNILELKTLKENIHSLKLTISDIILSISSNKDIAKMLGSIDFKEAIYHITPHPFHERNLSQKEINNSIEAFENINYLYEPDLLKIIHNIYDQSNSGKVVLVTGSLYLVGYVKDFINNSTKKGT